MTTQTATDQERLQIKRLARGRDMAEALDHSMKPPWWTHNGTFTTQCQNCGMGIAVNLDFERGHCVGRALTEPCAGAPRR